MPCDCSSSPCCISLFPSFYFLGYSVWLTAAIDPPASKRPHDTRHALPRYHGTRYSASAINCPQNAISLTHGSHNMFSDLHTYFDPVQGSNQNYTVHHIREPIVYGTQYPKNITFRSVTNVSLPDPDLFAIHRACARIAYATGAGEAAQRFFRDLGGGDAAAADGSTPLDMLVAFHLEFERNTASEQKRVGDIY